MAYQAPLSIHADLGAAASVDSELLTWHASPQPGVERRMLERDGAEVARATSIVRYASDSHFPAHTHGGGEEFLVLAGVFSDEQGDYPTGTYVRNPPGSSHAPFTRAGCTILVKLRQMQAQGEQQLVIDSKAMAWESSGAVARKRLFSAAWGEQVDLERVAPGGKLPVDRGPIEIFLLDGSLEWAGKHCEKGLWLRLPNGLDQGLVSSQGCEYWVKRGHF